VLGHGVPAWFAGGCGWIWCLLLVLFLIGSPECSRAGYVHASGTSLLDASGQPFLPRGVNLGSWLWPELWMMGGPNLSAYTGVDDFATLNAAVLDAVGGDTNLQAQALGSMRSNFVTSADVLLLHSNGFNCVRVPFHYQLFFQITNAANNYPTNGYDISTGFVYLDHLVGWCATNGIYVIPDMHGVPGGKDYSVAGNVYTNTSNHSLFLHVWNRIAAHFATNQWIGGYDLINEPVNNAVGYQLIPGTFLSTTFSDARNTIRSVDPNHLLICEGDYWATTLSAINTTGWVDANVCYSDHYYGNPLPVSTGNRQYCASLKIPLWCGEFGYNSTHWINNLSGEFVQTNTFTINNQPVSIQEGFCYWAYKAPQLYVPVENPLTAGWNTLMTYWASPGSVARPSATNTLAWLLSYAQGTLCSNCLTHAEVWDALTRSNASFFTQALPYRSGVAIPGKIMAVDYDMGADLVAYSDTVYDDEAGQGPGGVAWNSGWFGRDDGVDTATCTDPGALLKVGWNVAGEWQRHTVVCTPGLYKLYVRYGSGGSTNGLLRVQINGVDLAGEIPLPVTGSYTTYATYAVSNINIAAIGPATVELDCDQAGYDLVWVEFVLSAAPPLPPAGVAVVPGNQEVSLSWVGCENTTNYLISRSTTSGGPYIQVGGSPVPAWLNTGLTNGVTYYYVIAAVNGFDSGTNSPEVAVQPRPDTLPSPWLDQDVGIGRLWTGDAGDVGWPGSASYANGTYTVSGSGIDVWNNADSFHFLFRAVQSDTTNIIRVASLANTDPWAKAGIMIRETTAASSVNAFVCITSQNGVVFSWRSATGGTSASASLSGYAAPGWLKLVRVGNSFSAYASNNGSTWTQIGTSQVLPMAATVYAGLAVTAHNNTLVNSSTFDSMAFTSKLPAASTSLAATASGATVQLKWPAVSTASAYAVDRSSNSGGPYSPVALDVLGTNYSDTVSSNGFYYYVVTAINANGSSPNSPVATVAVVVTAPTLSLAASKTNLQLNWPAYASSFGLYSSTNLALPTVWSPVTNHAVTESGILVVTLPPGTNGCRFFRLAGP